MPKGIKGFVKGHKHSGATKLKIGLANKKVWIKFKCDYCGELNEQRPSHYIRKKRHFCNRKCYSLYIKEILPKEEQNAYKGGGISEELKMLRKNARSILNHAVRDKKLTRPDKCSKCSSNSKIEAHHHDYYKPLDVTWLCVKCHRKLHQYKHLLK